MWITLYLGPQCFCCTILRDVIFVEACSASVISTTCILQHAVVCWVTTLSPLWIEMGHSRMYSLGPSLPRECTRRAPLMVCWQLAVSISCLLTPFGEAAQPQSVNNSCGRWPSTEFGRRIAGSGMGYKQPRLLASSACRRKTQWSTFCSNVCTLEGRGSGANNG
jgi:hypothetical protein